MTGPAMTGKEETLTKLSGFDRALLSLIGLVTILALAAFADAPLLMTTITSAFYIAAIHIYGRMRRERDLPNPNDARLSRNDGLFDQRAIADNLAEAVWIISPREQIIYANHAAQNLFPALKAKTESQRENQTESQAESQMAKRSSFRMRRLATVMRDPDVRRLVSDVLAGQPAAPADYASSLPVERHFRVTGTPIEIEAKDGEIETKDSEGVEGSRRYAMLVFNDISDLVKFAATQGDFLANASHELKTPVASLLGYIETLRGHAKDDPQARETFLGIMQEQAERMQRLIRDLLSLRQIEQSEHLAPLGSADLRAAAEFAVDTAAPLAQARGVKVSITGPRALAVKGHEDELVQLCLNIIDNAVKMSPRGSAVTITLSEAAEWRTQDFIGVDKSALSAGQPTRRIILSPPAASAGYAVISVSDFGPGFAPKHIPRLGERFYRIAGDRSSREKGTGLGLAIVKHIILRHRGGLLVESLARPSEDSPLDIDAGAETSEETLQTGTKFTALIPLASPLQDS